MLVSNQLATAPHGSINETAFLVIWYTVILPEFWNLNQYPFLLIKILPYLSLPLTNPRPSPDVGSRRSMPTRFLL